MRAAWETFDYELGQLGGLWEHFRKGEHNGQPPVIRNAMVEAAILHLRSILEMLQDEAKRKDDYCLKDLIDLKDKPSGLHALMELYTKDQVYSVEVEKYCGGDPTDIAANLKRSPKWQTEKLMIHPTNNRKPPWNAPQKVVQVL